jgi:hypothetical protein
MNENDEIEELDDEYAEVEPDVHFDLSWICKECGNTNVEYNIPVAKNIICTCGKCNKQYKYYYEPY